MNEAHDVTTGLPAGTLAALSAADRAVLARLMARIAERAYRRGVCHAARLGADALPVNLDRWRFGIRLDVSPLLGSARATRPSLAFLFDHNPRLRRLGMVPPANMEPRL